MYSVSKLIFSVLFIFIVFLGCKDMGQKTPTTSSLPISEANVLHNQEGSSNADIENSRKEAADILSHRIKNSDASRAHTLLNDMWHVEAVLRSSDIVFGNNLNGAWFKFNDDTTYETGSYDKKLGGGRYHFDSEKTILLFLDNDPRMKPQEFNVMTNNNGVLVWVGEPTYKDNNMQIKLNRYPEFPKKVESKIE